ncbi:MAG TPA: CocE/NonD family hydrolase, partial [Thermosynechococcaceae cyanobacterium]
RNLPLGDRLPANPEILRSLAPDCFYHEWLAHPEPGPYWEALSPKTLIQQVDLPMLHIGGWFDTFLRGTVQLYKAMAERSQFRQQLVIGPWAHLPWGRKVGAVDYGSEAVSFCDRLQLRWFDHFLKNKDTGLLSEPPLTLFEIGSNHWRTSPAWNPQPSTPFYLSSDGLASMTASGQLSLHRPTASPDDIFVHDPWRPVPASGGHAAYPCGSFDRSSLDCRSDILTYTSEPLTEDLHLMGEITALLPCTADTPSFDLCVVLSEVHPNGSVYNLSQGYARVQARTIAPISIALQPLCACISHGHAIRLSLSAACFPAYPVNPGLDLPLAETRLLDRQIITLTLHHSDRHPAQVFLPIWAQ